MSHSFRRILPVTLATAAAALAVTAGPAAAAKPIVHQTPNVPIVVDGKKLTPKQIHRYDGQPLYTRMSADKKRLIATTSLRKFKAFLKKKGLTMPAPNSKPKLKARSSYSGHFARIFVDNFLLGHNYTVASGLGVARMAAISGSNWFTSWQFDNSVSSIQTYGTGALLYDLADFNPAWGTAYIGPNQQVDLAWFGWNDRLSSVFSYWN
jgi:hypothetical protein